MTRNREIDTPLKPVRELSEADAEEYAGIKYAGLPGSPPYSLFWCTATLFETLNARSV
jgi:hypothetical protein